MPNFVSCMGSCDDKVIVEGGTYTDKTSFRLSFGDVRSLYPFNGVSDGVIDFFIRLAGQGNESVDIWHWTVIAIVPASKKAYVLDSGAGSTKIFAQQVVVDLAKFFTNLIGLDISFDPVFIKVAEQIDGYNCGVHVMHNI